MAWARKIIRTMSSRGWRRSYRNSKVSAKLHLPTGRGLRLLSSKTTRGILRRSNLQNIAMTSPSMKKRKSSRRNRGGIPSTASFSKRMSRKKKRLQNLKASALRQLSCLRTFWCSKKQAYRICRWRRRLHATMGLRRNVSSCSGVRGRGSMVGRTVLSLRMVWFAIRRTSTSCGRAFTRRGTISILTDIYSNLPLSSNILIQMIRSASFIIKFKSNAAIDNHHPDRPVWQPKYPSPYPVGA